MSVASQLLEILLLSKTAKIPFLTKDYSLWSSKNLIDRNWLKKFRHVGVDVACMYTNFGECGLLIFGDIATFKNSQNSLSVYGHQKIESIEISSKNSCILALM